MKPFLAVLCIAGCSFIGVRGPEVISSEPAPDPTKVHCTDSDTLPSLDAIGGAAALAAAGGGFIIEQTSSTGDFHNFSKFYLGPLVAMSIIYFISTSFGTNRVEQCHAAKGDGVPEQ